MIKNINNLYVYYSSRERKYFVSRRIHYIFIPIKKFEVLEQAVLFAKITTDYRSIFDADQEVYFTT